MPSKRIRRYHREVWAAKRIIRRRVFRAIIKELKSEPCTDCGLPWPYYVMQYDHMPGTEKKYELGEIGRLPSIKAILAEIEKCELVCANCHAVRSHERRNIRV